MDPLLSALQEPTLYDYPVKTFRVVETHISWVLLTGRYAYKIKKPVNFGFADFSSLERRRFYCQEEVRLNRRLAPTIYLSVLPVTGSRERPRWDQGGGAIEYAVKMREFAHHDLLSAVAVEGRLESVHIDELAATIAVFHNNLESVSPSSSYGLPETVHHWTRENFRHIRPVLDSSRARTELALLERWTEQEFGHRRAQIQARKMQGFVRECHGDLHLGNITLVDGRVTPFDCIEFNAELRLIDVMSEISFLIMDLRDRGYPQYACRFINGYLAHTGDYAGVSVLRYYLVYRALVRAKVAVLRLAEGRLAATEASALRKEYQGYVQLALSFSQEYRPALIITHGVSGSGKSTVVAELVQHLGAIHIRSDVERKRLFGLNPHADTGSRLGNNIYTADRTRATYDRLASAAGSVLDFGWPVVVDATFLKKAQRVEFQTLAQNSAVPFLILDFWAPESVLRQRVVRRHAEGRDVSEAGVEVLDSQLRAQEPLTGAEQRQSFRVDTGAAFAIDALADKIIHEMRK
jgi:aminoglycoside phosphotransferase family enzyme/predicted kinase